MKPVDIGYLGGLIVGAMAMMASHGMTGSFLIGLLALGIIVLIYAVWHVTHKQ